MSTNFAGYINLEVTQVNPMPKFLGPFNPRKKIPSGPTNTKGKLPGGIETTKETSILYRSSSKTAFSFNSSQTTSLTSLNANPSLYMNLYVISTNYGYEVQGSDTYAKYYQRFYPISSVIRKATIQGIARNEYEYEDLAWWIRLAQTDLVKGNLDSIGLYIPASGINAFGFIPTFSLKLGAAAGEDMNPIPFAINYQFDFVILQDATDPQRNNFGDVMTQNNSYAVQAYRGQNYIQNSNYQQYTSGLNMANRAAGITVNYGNGITS